MTHGASKVSLYPSKIIFAKKKWAEKVLAKLGDRKQRALGRGFKAANFDLPNRGTTTGELT